jgi:UDP-N-acetylglucosamine--N-acetylmuramyl-(pentapeptide) pyrophosphoryl-undecaprenol N-acetylglucosamine transferase
MGRRLLVFGGSQGARSINDAIIENLAEYREAGIALRHQTGQADEERVRAAYAVAGMDEKAVAAFIDDMAGAYQEADLVLCRAGATTLAELAAAGKPSALIPFPFATHDHQTHNAMAFSSAGAGVVVMQDDMDGRKLFEIIRGLLDDPARLERMGAAASALGRPDAAARIAEGVAAIARPSREKPA